MESKEKVNFIFAAYDFSGAGELSYDESLLLFRSVVKGLSKICPGQAEALFGASNIQVILDTKMDVIVSNAMVDGSLTLSALQAYSNSHPVTSSWLQFCTEFQGEEISANEEIISKVFDNSSLCSEITFAPQAYHPSVGCRGFEEEKEAAPEADAPKEDGEDSEKGDELAKESNEEIGDGEKEGAENKEVLKVKPKVKDSKITPWMRKAMLLKPDEMPPVRSDNPSDLFDLNWVYGASGASGFNDSVIYTANHNVVYAASNYLVVASMAQASKPRADSPRGHSSVGLLG